MSLAYHTFFADFTGKDAAAILDAVYRESADHMGWTFPEWWTYQQKTWKKLAQAKIPDLGSPHAEQILLNILVETGALEKGLRPANRTAPSVPAAKLRCE